MEELNRRISSDWFHIKEKIDNIPETGALLKIQAEQLTEGINELRLAVENGVCEYKAKILKQTFNALESVKYDSKGFARVNSQLPHLTMLLFNINLERHLATGKIAIKDEVPQMEIPAASFDLKEIVADIDNRIKSDPGAAAKPEIKSILLKIKQYKKELTEFQKLRATIPQDKLASLAENFKKSIQEITNRIQDVYNQLIAHEETEILKDTEEQTNNPYYHPDLIKALGNQMQVVSMIMSTITFALKEGYNTREILLNLGGKTEDILRSFNKEDNLLRNIFVGDTPGSKMMKAELLRVLAKEEAWVIRKGRY